MPKRDPCKVFACRLQDCLEENKFQEAQCQKVIEALRECCRTWVGKSLVCDGFKPKPTQQPSS